MSDSVRGEPAFTIEDIVRLLLEDTNTLGPPTMPRVLQSVLT